MIKADTLRLRLRSGHFVVIGESPNRGLDCYLGEAYCRRPIKSGADFDDVLEAALRLMEQAGKIDSISVWSWERHPSIPRVSFPPDWDDTSKAMDFLAAANAKGIRAPIMSSVPDSEFWEYHLKKAFFEFPSIGVDTVIPCREQLAISVFFGPGAEKLPKREDPMVTVVTARTTAFWYPKVFESLATPLTDALRRSATVANLCMEKVLPFEIFSRYYFSLGHFVYRLTEVLSHLGIQNQEIGLRANLLDRWIDRALEADNQGLESLGSGLHSNDFCLQSSSPSEARWWRLTAQLLGRSSPSRDGGLEANRNVIDVVYQHRRLGHYYGAVNWLRRLIEWEMDRLSSHVAHLDNRSIASP